ncbi:MAG: enoyl-CoA hydratase/isomerase family protein, partial [Deltaproteobacteria bacterium]|nr:enoyl-CoA hydratase/isomerase family protein [Deltaproteobacteria bacterium]
MSSTPLILVDHPEGPIVSIRLNRPEVRNAFNDELIRELTELLKKLERRPEVRVVGLSGSGDFFSAGADLHWMKSMISAPKKVNEEDARRLAYLLQAMNEFSKPLIGMV